MQVTTNNHARELLTGAALPDGILESEFDYAELKEDSDEIHSPRFFKYRGSWYDVDQFERVSSLQVDPPLRDWYSVQTDSVWSGVVIRWASDDHGEAIDPYAVVVGSAYWG